MTEDWTESEDIHEMRARRQVLEIASRWTTLKNHRDDGLISWRNYVAVALRTVDSGEVGARLARVAPVPTAPAPERIDLDLNYDGLCPREPNDPAQCETGGGPA
jgi:hypothetical protein